MQSDGDSVFRVPFSSYTIHQTANRDLGPTSVRSTDAGWCFGRRLSETRQYRYLQIKTTAFLPRFLLDFGKAQGEELITPVTLNFLRIMRGKGVFLVCFWFRVNKSEHGTGHRAA